jgi:hypothetical protein
MRGLESSPLSFRDKTQCLTPRATESGYEHTYAKILARTLARTFRVTHLYKDMGDKEFWRRGGILPEHPKKFSVAMVKLKSFVVNEQIVEKPFPHHYWRF